MSQPQEALPAKLVARFLFRVPGVRVKALRALEGRFGPVDFVSAPGPFPYTTYYDREMGAGLRRQTASFFHLVSPGSLPDVKAWSNELEKELSVGEGRQVNIDPGILSEERFVLATGKNYTHRVYLRDGIYADLTLIYEKGGYRPLPWTYPDYREEEFLRQLEILRKKLKFQRDGTLPRVL